MIKVHVFEKIKPLQLTDTLLDKESLFTKNISIFGIKLWGYSYTRSFDLENQISVKGRKVGFMGQPISD